MPLSRRKLIKRNIHLQFLADSNGRTLMDSSRFRDIGGGETFTPYITGISQATLVSGTTSSGDWHGRASVVTLPSGVVVLTYRSGTSHGINDGELHIKFSDDYGATWTAEDTKLGGGGVTGFPMYPTGGAPADDEGPGEPWLYIAPNGNLILHMWNADYSVNCVGNWQSVSTDGGESWGATSQIDYSGIAGDNTIFTTCDHFVLNGVIYAGARKYTDCTFAECYNLLMKSTDNGSTWEYVSDISSTTDSTSGTNEVGLEYLGDGNIIAVLRDNDNAKTFKTTSTDMGATWAALSDITSAVGISGRHRVYTLAHLKGEKYWWRDQTLIMCGFEFISADPPSGLGRSSSVWISEDAGATWSGPYHCGVSQAHGSDAGYGDIFYDLDNDELVHINYWGSGSTAVDLYQYRIKLHGVS